MANFGLGSFPSSLPPPKLRETYQGVLDVIPNINQYLFSHRPLYNWAVHQGDVKTCQSYNKGKECYRNPCPFAHVCNRCYGGHPGIHCRVQLPECNKCGNVHSGSHYPTSQAQPNKPPPKETTQGNNNQPSDDRDDLYVYNTLYKFTPLQSM